MNIALVPKPAVGKFAKTDSPSKFKKDVLIEGTGVHPATGEVFQFDADFMKALASSTNQWISNGNTVFFPDGHSFSALDNLGEWSNFRVENVNGVATMFADVEVKSKEALEKELVGTTIDQVSVFVERAIQDSSGAIFDSVITHVAATPEPVIRNQSNFEALFSREKKTEIHYLNDKQEDAMDWKKLFLSLAKKLGQTLDAEDEASAEAVIAAVEEKQKEDDQKVEQLENDLALARRTADGGDDDGDNDDDEKYRELRLSNRKLVRSANETYLGAKVKEGRITPAMKELLLPLLCCERPATGFNAKYNRESIDVPELVKSALEAMPENSAIPLGDSDGDDTTQDGRESEVRSWNDHVDRQVAFYQRRGKEVRTWTDERTGKKQYELQETTAS